MLLLATLGAAETSGELPAVARARLAGMAGGESSSGTVFFLKLPGGGVAAVGAAHSFDLAVLTAAPVVEFHLGRTRTLVARSERFLAPPGRAFQDAEGSLAEDIVVFALDEPPRGARVLEPAPSPEVREGERVRILGVPAMIAQDEDDLFGRVAAVADGRIDVDLDVAADLRGWGGAPVLEARTGRVLGILEAALPRSGGYRLGLAPIDAVLDATEEPLENGRGARFASFALRAGKASTRAPNGGAEEVIHAEPDFEAGRASDTAAFEQSENELEEHLEAARASSPSLRKTEVQLAIDYPADGTIFDSAAGAFLAGTALAARGDRPRFDVVLVLDTSYSTSESTNVDVNGNGIVGNGGLRGLFRMGSDPGDSVLAAEVAAASRLIDRFDPRSVRVGVVTFSGSRPTGGGGLVIQIGGAPGLPPSLTESPLSNDYASVRRALGRVLERGPLGDTHMAAGLDQATIELLGLRGALSETDPKSQKLVVFLTDGFPTMPTGIPGYDVRASLRAAQRARRAGIRVHSFALGPEALQGPVAVVDMAAQTGGTFTPVRSPGDVVSMIETVHLVDLEALTVRNLSTQKDAEVDVRLDGGFGALVDLAPGKNRIEITARATDGTESKRELVLHYAPGSPHPEVPPALVPLRNALLERRLAALKQVGLGIERDRTEQARRELALEIQEQRRQAEARAAVQRRELRLEVEPETSSTEEPRP